MKTFLSPFLLLDEFDSLRLAFSQAKVLRPADLLIQWNVLLNVQETNSLGNILQRKKITVYAKKIKTVTRKIVKVKGKRFFGCN